MIVVLFSDEPGFYPRVLALCRALSQYLLSVNQLPSSLHIPSDKEHLITSFTCTAAEVKHDTRRMLESLWRTSKGFFCLLSDLIKTLNLQYGLVFIKSFQHLN